MNEREQCPVDQMHPWAGGGRVGSLSQAHRLVGRQRQDTEYHVPHRFGAALNHGDLAAKLILKPRIAALSDGAFLMPDGLSGG